MSALLKTLGSKAGPFRRAGRPIYRLFRRFVSKRPVRYLVDGMELKLLPAYGLPSGLPDNEIVSLDQAMRTAYTEAILPGDIVLDVGAFIGVYTLLAALRTGERGHVFSFEPSPDACNILRRHVHINGLGRRVTIMPCAVGERDAQCTFYVDKTLSGINSMNSLSSAALTHNGDNPYQPQAIETAMIRLDTFLAERKIAPAVIKIDVEGAELQVLEGLGEWLSRKVTILVEMHPYAWPSMGASEWDLLKLARRYGRQFYSLDGRVMESLAYGPVRLA